MPQKYTLALLILVPVIFAALYLLGKVPNSSRDLHVAQPAVETERRNDVSAPSRVRSEARHRKDVGDGSNEGVATETSQANSRDSGALWARRDLSELTRSNIEARRPTLLEGYGYMDLSKIYEREESYAHQAGVMASYAIMVIMDAEGRSTPQPDWLSRELYESTEMYVRALRDYRSSLPRREKGVDVISSGRTEYTVDPSEFPVYYEIKDLVRSNPSGVPLADVPLGAVRQLMDKALSYRLQ